MKQMKPKTMGVIMLALLIAVPIILSIPVLGLGWAEVPLPSGDGMGVLPSWYKYPPLMEILRSSVTGDQMPTHIALILVYLGLYVPAIWLIRNKPENRITKEVSSR